jgi:hypothetical protein
LQLGTDNIERLTKLMIDIFDILNLRFCSEGINPEIWKKKGKLIQMLQVFSETKRVYKENGKNINMFVSQTSLQAWRFP